MNGKIYGKWTVIGHRSNGPHKRWFCQCRCGAVKLVREQHLLSGASCGCLDSRTDIGSKFRHLPKTTLTKLLHVVDHAIARWTDESNEKYEGYGKRGITVKFNSREAFVGYLLTLPGMTIHHW